MNRVVITGGSAGIGAALVSRLRSEGQGVLFTFCRNEHPARTLAERSGAECCHYDQTVADSVTALAARIRQGGFDALINNAAPPMPRQSLLKTDPGLFVTYQAAALRGVFELSQAFAEQARQRSVPGAIVNVLSSVTFGMPPAKQAPYVTSKYALLGLTKSMAVEFIRYGIRVNAVSPGMTRTNFNAALPERFIEQYEASLPMERLATPDEVAATIRFLLSSDASYISGVNIAISGGQVC